MPSGGPPDLTGPQREMGGLSGLFAPLPPPAGQAHVASFPDLASSLPPPNQEIVSLRARDEKHFRNPDGSYLAVFGHNLHYEASKGNWQDVDLNFRPTGRGYIVDRNDVVVTVSDAGISVTARNGGQGIRWELPERPQVAGRLARFTDQGLDWQYATTPDGVKLTATVNARLRPRHYEFGYNPVGGANDLTVNDHGDLVGDGFVVPRPIVAEANGAHAAAERWQVLAGRRVAFDFDDSALPPDAYPYVLDPTTTFNFPGSFAPDDAGWVQGTSSTYPPPSATVVVNKEGSVPVGKDLLQPYSQGRRVAWGGSYPLYVTTTGLVRWNTSSLPQNAVLTGASVRGYVQELGYADGADLEFNFPSSYWPIGPEDYVADPGPPQGAPFYLSWLTNNAYNDFGINNYSAISRTGYTGLQMLIHGQTAPTGLNGFDLRAPDLIVTYNLPVGATQGGGGGKASPNLACTVRNRTGHPVTTSTGNFWHTFDDMAIPGRGPALDLARTYNSTAAATDSPFGFGWSSS